MSFPTVNMYQSFEGPLRAPGPEWQVKTEPSVDLLSGPTAATVAPPTALLIPQSLAKLRPSPISGDVDALLAPSDLLAQPPKASRQPSVHPPTPRGSEDAPEDQDMSGVLLPALMPTAESRWRWSSAQRIRACLWLAGSFPSSPFQPRDFARF